MTGRLGIVRKVQMRTLRDKHSDQHWNSAITRTFLEWTIAIVRECKVHSIAYRNVVRFSGLDDKCKVPVGDKVPISTNVRYNTNAIVPVETSAEGGTVNAADHDFSCANIIPSVTTLLSNIPDSMEGSFFGGGFDVGTGEIEGVLRDATFEPSNVFDHTA